MYKTFVCGMRQFYMYNKHLMTGPKGNSEVCFPWGQLLSVLLYLPTQTRTIHGFLHGICRCFKGARPDHVRVESSSRCFLRGLVSFVCPRELVSFDPWHVTYSPPIGKRIWVRRYNKIYCLQESKQELAPCLQPIKIELVTPYNNTN